MHNALADEMRSVTDRTFIHKTSFIVRETGPGNFCRKDLNLNAVKNAMKNTLGEMAILNAIRLLG